MARLAELLARQGAGAGGPRDLRIDGLLSTGAATVRAGRSRSRTPAPSAPPPPPRALPLPMSAGQRPPDRRDAT